MGRFHEIVMSGRAKNALGTEMMMRILHEIREGEGRPLLLTGSGDAFSAGLDLKEVLSLDGEAMLTFLRLLERCMSALYLYPGPTVALVNGHAIAGGCVLTLCCDRRVVVDQPKIKIGLNEVALGVRFPPRVLAIVKARVPPRHVEEVVLGGGLFDPHAAQRLGLVDEVSQDAAETARTRLATLAQNSAEGYALAKRDLRGNEQSLCPDDIEERSLREALSTWTAPAVRQKIAAVLAKLKA